MLRGVVVAVAVAGCFKPEPPASPARVTQHTIPIRGLELANGLRVVIIPDPKASEVQVTMRYRVGSADDPPEHPGIAHLVEHLMYQQILGAKTVFARLLDDATSLAGFTTYDATTYSARAHPSRLDELLSIDSVRMSVRCASISDAVFTREREVVLNELRLHDEGTELYTALSAGVYPEGHPYRRPSGGTEDTVASITRDQACAFADAHYAPENAVLVVSGAVKTPEVETAVTRLFGRMPKRSAVPRTPVPPLGAAARRVEVEVPFDRDALLIAWPLPSDPSEQARMRAVEPAALGVIQAKVKGFVTSLHFGDERAPAVGIVVFPAKNETLADVIAAAQLGLARAPSAFKHVGWYGQYMFDRYKQVSIYRAYADLEDGSGRDVRIASDILAGHNPNATIHSELTSFNELTGDVAAEVTETRFAWNRATIVTLKASGQKRGKTARLEPAIHDLGMHRDVDAADAHRPASPTPTRALDAMRTRQLANGLKVVLLPVTSTPTVEARLIFSAGTADEPAEKRGVALLAAYTLEFDLHYLEDLMRFAGSSGTHVSAGVDSTTFTARGLQMHLDLMLAGLRRWVREGVYLAQTRSVIRALNEKDKQLDDDGALGDAWKTALFGGGHPYVNAGVPRQASTTLTANDAAQFRAMHFTPDNATLVIAGGFDPALAERWIDYLFADWQGHAVARVSARSNPQPASLAKADDIAFVHIGIAIPATAGDRATQLVAAAMLDEITWDVRHQLGASYGFSSSLAELRLAKDYFLRGSVDAHRAREAMELVSTRLAKLRTDADAAARAFVSARGRVLSKLGTQPGRAAVLASLVEDDVAVDRPMMSERQTAAAVQALTIESMASTLAELDLARAVVFATGPKADVDAAFAALGRTPSYIHADTVQEPDREPTAASDDDSVQMSVRDFSEALTTHRSPLVVSLAPAYTTGSENGQDASGFSVTGSIAIGLTRRSAFGVSVTVGSLDSSYITDPNNPTHPTPSTIVPMALDVFLQATTSDRLYGALFAGLHVARRDEHVVLWDDGLGIGVQGGFDVLTLGRNRLGLFARGEFVVLGDGYNAFTVGLAYRH